MSSKQPFTFPYEFSDLGEEIVETRIQKKYPFLWKRMPFNYVLIEAEREMVFYINQDEKQTLFVPLGGGVVEADHINLWSWKIKNFYNGVNKVNVVVQRE